MATLFDDLETPDVAADDPAAVRLPEIHRRLCEHFGCPIDYFHSLDPLGELVSSMLSHRTRNKDSGRAFRQLRDRFATWDDVLAADVADVEAAISPCTWPEAKAPAIRRALAHVRDRVGHLDEGALDFLGDLPPREARDWLEAIPGVGPKTSAAVLSFSRLRGRALPVDSHHHRVALRLGLLKPSVTVGPSHAVLDKLLPADWDAQDVYDHHEVMMFLGQQVCHHRNPACDSCPLLDLCPTGQARVGPSPGR